MNSNKNSVEDRNIGSKHRRYWLYAPGREAKMWDEFYEKEIMGIGWSNLGDIRNYKSKKEIAQKLRDLDNTTSSKVNDAAANYDFTHNMSIGDIIIVKKGRTKYLGYGIVQSDYDYAQTQKEYKSYRKVEWRKKGEWEENFINLPNKTLTEITSNLDQINKIRQMFGIREVEERKNVNLNQILYGPPGTGKTYNTVNKALEICGEKFSENNRLGIKELFDQKINEGKIVFTTFHQSMSYEDFIEGIKPIEPEKEGDPVYYRVEDGIFKRLCVEAAFSLAKKKKSLATKNVLDFSFVFDNYIQDTEEIISSKKYKEIRLNTRNGGEIIIDSISQQGNIIVKHSGGETTYTVSKSRLLRLNAAFPDLNEVNNINQQFKSIIGGCNSTAYWSVLNDIRNKNYNIGSEEIVDKKYSWEDKVQVVRNLEKEDYMDESSEPYILIIDEINRGNISQIFGELITLIEEDKRLGNPEAIKVQLPYSKDWFGVPPNLYIIGTMNTADRSVEALDTALRRRFSFIEMSPDPELISEKGKAPKGIINSINLSVLLKTINRRIEKLLDKDHMIGHSYFLPVENLIGLKYVFQNKIIPLLQEYFFGDYGKIGLILGSDFFDINNMQEDNGFFADFGEYDAAPFIEKRIYNIKDITKMSNAEFEEALDKLIGKNN